MVYYVYSHFGEPPKENDVQKLYEVLKNKRGEKPFKLILLISKKINVENIIQITDDVTMNDKRVNEYILNIYGEFDNKFTKFKTNMERKIKKETGIH